MQPFDPIFSNPHALTLAGNFWPRTLDEQRFPVERQLYPTEPGIQVLVQSQRPAEPVAGEVILVHGLEGSGESGYMRSLSQAGLEAGYAMHRFHMRSCGGMAHVCRTLYHAGQTSDLLEVLRRFEAAGCAPVYLIGFSLGGNVALKLAGELGDSATRYIASVCAVSTPIDLDASTRRINRIDNRVYERRFVRRMQQRLLETGLYTRRDFAGVHSIFTLDEKITAPFFGFQGAGHYYATQSAVRFLDSIRVPTLVLQAMDDTFIPFEIFHHPSFKSNPYLNLVATEKGGHLGFIARGRPRFWLDVQLMEWIRRHPVKRVTST
ncbi:MAG: YheT family hydrolase [Bryobacteraceae bacterium]